MRPTTLLIVAAAGVTVLLLVRVEAPGDLGAWRTAALPGEPVLSVVDTGAAVVAGGRSGLVVLERAAGRGRAAEADHVTDAPVQALAATGDRIWVGTTEGLGELTEEGYRPLPVLAEPVHALHAAPDGTLLVGSASGLHRVEPDHGGASRLWPGPGEPGRRVDAVLAAGGTVLLDHPDGLASVAAEGAEGAAEILVPGADVTALGSLAGGAAGQAPAGATRLWAGLRGAPLLLVSDDGGRTWRDRGEGLGFSATNALAAAGDHDGAALWAGGSGLADGNGQAGVMTSSDGGRSWQAEQDRLSNTHVSGLLTRRERLTVSLRLAGGLVQAETPLPVSTTRWYAATNGSGLVTQRPAAPVLDAAAPLVPVLRLAEPLLLGSLLLALAVASYRAARLGPLARADTFTARRHEVRHGQLAGRYREPAPDQTRLHHDPDNNNTKENPYA